MNRIPHQGKTAWFLTAILIAIGALTLTAGAIQALAQTFTDLHDFNGAAGDPYDFAETRLAQGRDSNFYGASTEGGTNGFGTVARMTPTGSVSVIFSFSGTDGANPIGGMTLGSDGNLYGNATSGGSASQGVVFKVTPAGVETVLHNFMNSGDGNFPEDTLVLGSDGNFYGTTNSTETIYRVSSSGTFKTVQTFPASPSGGGQLSQGGDGSLYGGMNSGGSSNLGFLYKMTTAGKVTVLLNLNGANGSIGSPGMVQAPNGLFYGTTQQGGTSNAGVIYKISSGGAFTLLHSMNASSDGQQPFALTLANDGNFYGVSGQGGSSSCGTIFKVTQAGAFSVLHSFDNTHGCTPSGHITQGTDGVLYGVTTAGGAHGNGVFYSVNLGLAPFILLQSTTGKVGSKVGILGQGFDSGSVVKFNGVTAPTRTVTGTSYITATVPAGASDGYVTVTTGATTLTSTQIYLVHNSWGQGAVMPTARFGAFAGAIGQKIYVIGGATNSGYQVTNVNEIYNTQTNTWTTGAPDPTARELGASAVVNGKLYVIGGSTSGSNPLNLVEVYNPISNNWTTKSPMPTARNSMPAVVYKNDIYVIGGYDPNTQVWYDVVERYDTTTDTWTEEAPLPIATAWSAVGLLGSTIVSTDGNISPGTVVGTNEGYNPTTNKWTGLTADPTPRLESCFAAISGQLYVAGGGGASQVLTVNEAYNSTTKAWTSLASVPQATEIPGSATVGGRLYCFGGANFNLTSVYNNVQIYQP